MRTVNRPWCLAIVLLGWCLVSAAQTAAPAGGEAAGPGVSAAAAREERVSWRQMVENGGLLMYVLGAMSVGMLSLAIYFLIVLRDRQVVPPPLYRELMEKMRLGAMEDARRACEYKPSPLSLVILAALDHIRNVPDAAPADIREAAEAEGARQARTALGQTEYLLDIAVIAPMVGLLGTVIGMIEAFSGVALDIAKAKPIVLAGGVSKALITTAFGLAVSIPAMTFYAYFRRRAGNVVSHLEAVSSEVITVMLSKRAP